MAATEVVGKAVPFLDCCFEVVAVVHHAVRKFRMHDAGLRFATADDSVASRC